MKLIRLGWYLVLSSVIAAGFAPAVRAAGNTHNGLSSQAFRRNALTINSDALAQLMSHALNDALFTDHPYVRTQLHDPNARAVMEEIVRCALAPSSSVSYIDPLGGNTTYRWTGELGLCQRDAVAASDWQRPWPSWGPGGPNPSCQQLVTACLLARVNALKVAVPISLRGQPSVVFPLRPKISTDTILREGPIDDDPNHGAPIGSFGGPLCVAGHECDWAPAYVGKCDQGQIQLAFQDPADGATPLRVCTGIQGCYGPSSGYAMPPRYPQDPQRQYAKRLFDTEAHPGAPIAFACPIQLPSGGYYSVMTRPLHAAPGKLQPVHPPSPPVVLGSGRGSYPATEQDVFTFREGGFYGNLFEPARLAWRCEVTADQRVCTPQQGTPESCGLGPDVAGRLPCRESDRSLPYSDVYACYSLAQQEDTASDDDQGAAYLNDRICDQPAPDAPCFPHKPKRCYFSNPQTNQANGSHCAWQGGAGVFQDCQGADGTPYPPITTYLNDPCDLLGGQVAQQQLCSKLRRSLIAAAGAAGHGNGTAGVPSVGPGPRGCGCATGAGGGIPPIGLAVLLAGILRARRRRIRGAGGA